ncbi:polysaccharide deacetylase family protein [Oceanobacillus jeddahense]|uniref:polysaccharide deacetylase family protein n=1 Tax=Oceanobacillus jeddahense TaxID=1462527 RepID=UPI000595FF82|nr:polysaccharide deacetylase family protein [Oceanobacillus jeddahense]
MKKKILYTITFLLLTSCFFFIIHEEIHAKNRFDFEKDGDIFWDAKTEEKVIALTFDDGPHSKYTPAVLNILSEYGAKATFFVLGAHAEKFPDIIYRQVMEGHEIGNHTYDHTTKLSRLSQEMKETSDIIYAITGNRPKLFRPVGGEYNNAIVRKAKENQLHPVLWSWDQDTKDWNDTDYKTIADNVIRNVSPGDVILFHDAGGNREETVKALPLILDYLAEHEYETITVSEMMKKDERITEN